MIDSFVSQVTGLKTEKGGGLSVFNLQESEVCVEQMSLVGESV